MDPTTALTAAVDNATKVANTPFFTTVIDKVTGFKISKWAAEGEVRKKIIHDEYEKAKENGIIGVQYISSLRETTNLIDTAVKSTKYIEQGKENEIKMDNDFFWNTIEHSKTVSNEEVQELIAKIIAGEYNQPGSYSISTLQSIKMLGKDELELFEKVCGFLVNGDQLPHSLFSGRYNLESFMKDNNLDFRKLQLLQTLGLFLPNDMVRTIENDNKNNLEIRYFDKSIIYSSEDEKNTKIKLPNFYGLSPIGEQIIKHLSPKYIESYYVWLKENYKIPHYKVVDEEKE